MIKIVDKKDRKDYLMEKKGYSVIFTLLDMGEFVGHENRHWYEEAEPFWTTSKIKVYSEDPNKRVNGSLLIDSRGRFLSLIIEDEEGNKRITILKEGVKGLTDDQYERLFENGGDDSNLLIEIYEEASEDHYLKQYFYDKKKGQFIDSDGNVAKECILTNKDLSKLFRAAARNVTKEYNKVLSKRKERKYKRFDSNTELYEDEGNMELYEDEGNEELFDDEGNMELYNDEGNVELYDDSSDSNTELYEDDGNKELYEAEGLLGDDDSELDDIDFTL